MEVPYGLRQVNWQPSVAIVGPGIGTTARGQEGQRSGGRGRARCELQFGTVEGGGANVKDPSGGEGRTANNRKKRDYWLHKRLRERQTKGRYRGKYKWRVGREYWGKQLRLTLATVANF